MTGSTSGIGLGIAEMFAKEGSNLVLNGLGDRGEIEKLRVSLAKQYGIEVLYHGADMTKEDQIADMVASACYLAGRGAGGAGARARARRPA